MNEQEKPANLDDLVAAATDNVRQQQDKAAALAARRPPRPRAKQIFTLLLVALFAGFFLYQYPRFSEPYALGDPDTSSAVVEAEIEAIAGLIEVYRLSQGNYPDSLEKVQFPAGLAEALAKTKLEYRLNDKSYMLEWTLPRWHAMFDSATGKLEVTATIGAK